MGKSGGTYLKFLALVVGITLTSLTLGIGAYIGSLYSPDKKQYQTVGSPAGAENNYSGPSQSLPDIEGVGGAVERIIANPPPKTGEDHEKRDLAAQEAMAVWAFWMVVVSAITGIVSTFGLWALLITIRQNREAIAKAAEANEISRSQLAAELVVSSIRVNINQYFNLSISFRNTGAVKANGIRLSIRPRLTIKVPEYGPIPFSQNELQFDAVEIQEFLIQAGQEARIFQSHFYYDPDAMPLNTIITASEIHRGISVLIVGEIEWTDQLSKISKTGFHAVLNPQSIKDSFPIQINEYEVTYFTLA